MVDSDVRTHSDSVRRARFHVGQPVNHKLFGYRGVIIDADPIFDGSTAWYDAVARTRPPKDQPWYHVLVHDSETMTYVAERNLEPDLTGRPINHPGLPLYFDGQDGGLYIRRGPSH